MRKTRLPVQVLELTVTDGNECLTEDDPSPRSVLVNSAPLSNAEARRL